MIVHIAKSYMLENVRNLGVLLGNLLPAFLFIPMSWASKFALTNSTETFDYMVKGQFLPISIMLLIYSFAFSAVTINLVELKANRTFHWLKRTDISSFAYYLGMGAGVFILMNIFLVFILVGYGLFIPISLRTFFMILLMCNFVLLTLYPLSFILAGMFKNEKVAQSMLTSIMIVGMFSITMPSLFLTINGKDPQDYYVFLSWNPMLYLNDTLQTQLDVTNSTWLPFYQYLLILLVLSVLLSVFAKKMYGR